MSTGGAVLCVIVIFVLFALGASNPLLALGPRAVCPFPPSAPLLRAYIGCDTAAGAHARRTGQCSAFGELLDHGLDILNVVYISYLTALALGAPPRAYFRVAEPN